MGDACFPGLAGHLPNGGFSPGDGGDPVAGGERGGDEGDDGVRSDRHLDDLVVGNLDADGAGYEEYELGEVEKGNWLGAWSGWRHVCLSVVAATMGGVGTWRQYSSKDMHRRLLDRCLSDRWRAAVAADEDIPAQALHCPYYVPLEGRLGGDWGVILNPESSRFGLLTFEHDDCGCPDTDDRGDEYRHYGAPDQAEDTWWDGSRGARD